MRPLLVPVVAPVFTPDGPIIDVETCCLWGGTIPVVDTDIGSGTFDFVTIFDESVCCCLVFLMVEAELLYRDFNLSDVSLAEGTPMDRAPRRVAFSFFILVLLASTIGLFGVNGLANTDNEVLVTTAVVCCVANPCFVVAPFFILFVVVLTLLLPIPEILDTPAVSRNPDILDSDTSDPPVATNGLGREGSEDTDTDCC